MGIGPTENFVSHMIAGKTGLHGSLGLRFQPSFLHLRILDTHWNFGKRNPGESWTPLPIWGRLSGCPGLPPSYPSDAETGNYAATATIALGRRHQLTSYDAAYLELAMRHGAVLTTLDAKLHKAAVAEGVAVLPPQ
jgi:hypothetical protein